MVIRSYGATEAKVPDIVDAIVDLTETGSSLRKNGLRDPRDAADQLHRADRGRSRRSRTPRSGRPWRTSRCCCSGAIQARGNVLLKLNVPADRLAAVTDMLPALSSPTITTLARGNMNAVETVVPKRGVNTLIPALKAAGAQDILEIPISKIVRVAVTVPEPNDAPGPNRPSAGKPPGCCRSTSKGRVLLLHGWDPHHPDHPFWFTIGGAVEEGDGRRVGVPARRGRPRAVRGDPHLGRPRAAR